MSDNTHDLQVPKFKPPRVNLVSYPIILFNRLYEPISEKTEKTIDKLKESTNFTLWASGRSYKTGAEINTEGSYYWSTGRSEFKEALTILQCDIRSLKKIFIKYKDLNITEHNKKMKSKIAKSKELYDMIINISTRKDITQCNKVLKKLTKNKEIMLYNNDEINEDCCIYWLTTIYNKIHSSDNEIRLISIIVDKKETIKLLNKNCISFYDMEHISFNSFSYVYGVFNGYDTIPKQYILKIWDDSYFNVGYIYHITDNTLHYSKGPAYISIMYDAYTTKKWYKHGVLHNTEGPAIIALDDEENISEYAYYINGSLHRDAVLGPAYYSNSGNTHIYKFYKKGLEFRKEGPSTIKIEYITDDVYSCNKDKSECDDEECYEKHFIKKEKIITKVFEFHTKIWKDNDEDEFLRSGLHRSDGPAMIKLDNYNNVIDMAFYKRGIEIDPFECKYLNS